MKEKQNQLKPDGKVQLWQKTQYSNLVRYVPSGRYYARFRNRGKLIWKSMKTDKVSVAHLRLGDLLNKHRQAADHEEDVKQGKQTMGAALDVVMERIRGDRDLKPKTKANAEERVKALKRSWPGLERLDVRTLDKIKLTKWKTNLNPDVSAVRFNQFLRFVRWALEVAVEYGNRFDNPAMKIDWMKEPPKKLKLPEPDEFTALVKSIRASGWIDAEESARFVLFMAYTGCRLTEGINVRWQDVDFERGKLKVLGDPVTGTKGGESRDVPLIQEARELLEMIRAERISEPPSATILRYHDARKALAGACKRIKIARISNHDLRHLFATRCIESGVDIPTVSRWLGHKDGGALAMRVYGHLRDAHSTEMAKQVSFSVPTQKNVVPMPKEAAI